MSCGKAQEIDLAAYLVDPDRPEWAEFREHYPTCPDCAEEVAAWNRIEASLRSAGDPQQGAHPAVELLARFEEDPRALSPDEWQRVDAAHARLPPVCRRAGRAAGIRLLGSREQRRRRRSGRRCAPWASPQRELLRSLGRWAMPGPGDEAVGDLFGMREPDLVFQSREAALSGIGHREGGAPRRAGGTRGRGRPAAAFAVPAGESRIGRAKDCEIRIPSQSLSRVEASIRAESDALEITALHERAPRARQWRASPLGPAPRRRPASDRK